MGRAVSRVCFQNVRQVGDCVYELVIVFSERELRGFILRSEGERSAVYAKAAGSLTRRILWRLWHELGEGERYEEQANGEVWRAAQDL